MLLSVHREVGRRLLGAGLPLSYVKRVIAELDDHAIDAEASCVYESRTVDSEAGLGNDDARACLGVETDLLVKQFVCSYRMATWFRRLPGFCWLLLPIPLCLITWPVWYASNVILLEQFVEIDNLSVLPFEARVLEGMFYAGKLIVPLIASWLLIKAQLMAGIAHRVRIVGFCVLSLMFFFTVSDLTLPSVVDMSMELSVAIDGKVPPHLWVWQAAQAAIVLVVLCVEGGRWRRQTSAACPT